MDITRRDFVAGAAALGLTDPRRVAFPASPPPVPPPADRFDPWLEIEAAALRHNTHEVSQLARGRPILAVVKNNAYGLGLTTVAPILERLDAIAGFAVVKAEAAMALRDAGIRKPVLLMAMTSDDDGEALARRDVQLSLYTEDAPNRIARLGRRVGRPIAAQWYLDTGMGRMGLPYHRADQVIMAVNDLPVRVEGTFMAFTEESDFDPEQLRRFNKITDRLWRRGAQLGQRHAASSNGVFHLPDAHLDQVRPGIALYGAYPSRPDHERRMATLRPAVRLRARVVRVAKLRAGDTVSYGRNYVANRETWTATLPVGHTDGLPRGAVNGARILINERLYPVIGAVSASHCIVEIGPAFAGQDPPVAVGDVATLVGPDHPAIEPNAVAAACEVSVYDVLMHLSPSLPRTVV